MFIFVSEIKINYAYKLFMIRNVTSVTEKKIIDDEIYSIHFQYADIIS